MEASEVTISIISNTCKVLHNIQDIRESSLGHHLIIEVLFPSRTVLWRWNKNQIFMKWINNNKNTTYRATGHFKSKDSDFRLSTDNIEEAKGTENQSNHHHTCSSHGAVVIVIKKEKWDAFFFFFFKKTFHRLA